LAVAAASVIVCVAAVAGHAASEKTWKPIQVVTALKRAGLPIAAVRYYTARSDPNKLLGRPFQYTGKANFHDRRIARAGDTFDVDNGGSVETFSNTADASSRFKYVQAIVKSTPLFAEYDYLEGTVMLRLSHKLTPSQAKGYERAFRKTV
jgi:hypothetical protein